MAAKDLYHQTVINALESDGWLITHNPYKIKHRKRRMEIDLGAEKIIAAEKQNRKIAVEVKSFLSASRMYDFHLALGQYITYRRILNKNDVERILFLAIPKDAYDDFFNTAFGQETIFEENLKIFVFDAYSKTIVKWIQ